ncbi:MAG TPA: hypothetical protein VM513_22660 [Kofleriaceae bacterium]|jgi:hypothetical protein|nr:hypothetical protein [Kofleriaceae bacterium]
MHRSLAVTIVLAACGGSSSSSPDAALVDSDPGADSALGDAPVIDAPVDDAAVVDAPLVPQPVVCGGETCPVDQTCEQGTCRAEACVGASVPGDYATIQSAVTALAAAGNDATICLSTQAYAASYIELDDPGNHGKALRIVGAGMDRSKITTHFYVGDGWSSVSFEHLEITSTSGFAIYHTEDINPDVSVIASRLRGFEGIRAYEQANVLVSASIIDVAGYGLDLYHSAASTGPTAVRIEDSYLTGAGGGAIRSNNAGAVGKITISVLGSTFRGNDIAISLEGKTTATIASSIFTGITQLALTWTATDVVTHANNALWGNVTNYGGVAVDGAGYVKTDCLLTQTSPVPGLGASSPCRNAGDATHATQTDFYGVPRSSPPDIGPVEAP